MGVPCMVAKLGTNYHNNLQDQEMISTDGGLMARELQK